MSYANVTCPHCGFINRFPPANDPTTAYCNSDDGGCDKPVLYRAVPITRHAVTVYKFPEPIAEGNANESK